ncbi:MAG: hypothetical protein H7A46_01915 [Verrucomicrobiales bacterium]|nr:hypothetical protein [Verrucomicrobiales bacterium]
MTPLPLLRRKRVLFPVLSLLLLGLATAVAVLRSDISSIVVYNETGAPVDTLRISACSQTATFYNLAEEGSIRWKLGAEGVPGPIGLETATEPPWTWRGGYAEPRGGYRVFLRLWPDGVVESHVQLSFWHRLVGNRAAVDEEDFTLPQSVPGE